MRKLLFFLIVLVTNLTNAQTSEISGVITYFFNEYQGDKPDMGAKVYVIDSLAYPTFDFKLMNDFYYGKSHRTYYNIFISKYLEYDGYAKKYEGKKRHKINYEKYRKFADENKGYADDSFLQMETYGVETDAKYESMCTEIYTMCIDFELLNRIESKSRTVDGSGNYSLKLASGTYYVIIRSKNRTSLNVLEMNGDFYSKKVKLKEGETIDVSYNFDIK